MHTHSPSEKIPSTPRQAVEGHFTLDQANRKRVCDILQKPLVELINASLTLKQAHWVLRGPRFLPVHTKLDEIVDETRAASDDTAERIVTLGFAADGRLSTVAATTSAEPFPEGFVTVAHATHCVLHTLSTTIDALREAQLAVADLDAVSEDLIISIAQGLEKQRWMLEAEIDA